jgi:hypothetical protein
MNIKSISLLFLIALLSSVLLIGGCTKDSPTLEDQDILKKVIQLEKNEYLLKTVQISYSEYLKNVNPLIFTNSSYLDKYKSEELRVKVKNIFNFQVINKSEILNADKDELQKVRDRLMPPNMIVTVETTAKYEPLRISKVYNDESMKGKIVFVTQLEDAYTKGSDVMYYRSYIFRKENNEWKVFDIRNSAIMAFDNGKGGFNAGGVNKTDIYEEFNGEKVVYDTTISVEQYDLK